MQEQRTVCFGYENETGLNNWIHLQFAHTQELRITKSNNGDDRSTGFKSTIYTIFLLLSLFLPSYVKVTSISGEAKLIRKYVYVTIK